MSSSSKSLFSSLDQASKIEVVEVCKMFVDDLSPPGSKHNLSIGGYLNEKGQTHLFKVVRKVEEEILKDEDLSHAYLPSLGEYKHL